MNFKSNVLSNLIMLSVALLLVIALKFWGIADNKLSTQAEFSGIGRSAEKCFVGIIDPERSQVNQAAKSFTCRDSFIFLYDKTNTYTSPLVDGRGFKIAVPQGWAVEEKMASGAGDWIRFSQFSSDNSGKYSLAGGNVDLSVVTTPAKTFAEFQKMFPGATVHSIGGFETLTDDRGVSVFVGPGVYWLFSPSSDFVLNTLEKIGK